MRHRKVSEESEIVKDLLCASHPLCRTKYNNMCIGHFEWRKLSLTLFRVFVPGSNGNTKKGDSRHENKSNGTQHKLLNKNNDGTAGGTMRANRV